ALLVRVLDGGTNLHEQVEPRLGGEVILAAVFGDANPLHELHDEVRPAGPGRAGVEHARDVRMVHHRQRLAFGLEARDDLPGVHAELDDLQGHAAAHGFLLFGHEDHAAAAFADLLEKFVAADTVAGLFSEWDEVCATGDGTVGGCALLSGGTRWGD